ncbi:M48 family metallopeptidase [Paraburkholderia tagetis]|uniref:M48 family metalloprotease n=1 Tax=Paraburkholderia tagetis TaxID=2913261 RepID=A0A9X1UJQ6_9BURK|nr:M48 family metalloprotease [Paraburkholderia tagetis]MCG5077107.1 M48 family metalloprotease [Paraburkholderia tagetis]
MRTHSYPQFARRGLAFAIAVFFVTALVIELSKSLALPGPLLIVAQAISAFLLLPLLATGGFVTNMAEQQTKGIPFTEDKSLRALLEPFLLDSEQGIVFGYCESEVANAYAFDPLFGGKKIIAITSALRDRASPDQLVAIGAHEIAHFRHGDARNKWYLLAFHHMVSTWPRLFAMVSDAVLKKALPAGVFCAVLVGLVLLWARGPSAMVSFLLSLVTAKLILYISSAVALIWAGRLFDRKLHARFCDYSREREFAADASAAKMTSPILMTSALEQLDDPGNVVGIFDTHPPILERKARLLKM